MIDFIKRYSTLFATLVHLGFLAAFLCFVLLDYHSVYRLFDDEFSRWAVMSFAEKAIACVMFALLYGLVPIVFIYLATFLRDRSHFFFSDSIVDWMNLIVLGGGSITCIVFWCSPASFAGVDPRIFTLYTVIFGFVAPCLIYSVYRVFSCTSLLKILVRPIHWFIEMRENSLEAYDLHPTSEYECVRNARDYDVEVETHTEYETRMVDDYECHDVYAKDQYTNYVRVGKVEIRGQHEETEEREVKTSKKRWYTQKRKYRVQEGVKVSRRTGRESPYSRTVRTTNLSEKKYDDD